MPISIAALPGAKAANDRVGDESVGRDMIRATPYVWRDPATIPARPWIYGRWFLSATAAAVIAPGGVGKTTLIASICVSSASGKEILGKTIWNGPTRVWLWNLEDDLVELSRSIQAAALHHGITAEDLSDRLFVDSAMDGTGLCTAVRDGAGFKLLAPVYGAITAELIARKITVLIIDPFVSSHNVEENANSEIDAIAKAWARVAKAASCCVILVHHANKAGSQEVTVGSARGASALTDACRSTLVLNRMSAEEAERLGIEDEAERRRYFTVRDDKSNRAPAIKSDWFRLASVDLGNGDSVGVAEPWSMPDPFDGLTVHDLHRVQLAIADGEYRENWQSADWAGIAVARVLTLDPDAKADRRRIRELLQTWVREGAMAVVSRKDPTTRKPVKWIEVGRWANDVAPP